MSNLLEYTGLWWSFVVLFESKHRHYVDTNLFCDVMAFVWVSATFTRLQREAHASKVKTQILLPPSGQCEERTLLPLH